MSRVSLIQQLYGEKKKTALEFNFDQLSIPPMNLFLSVIDIQRLHQIATSVRYAGNIDKKYEMIDKVMKHRSFHKLAAGTNRVVYYHLEDPRFVAKIAIDKVGLGDNPKEFENQKYLKPFCTKVFEVDPTGTVALVERVNPITSIEEFASVGEDVFNLITQKIIGKYVLDDIGVTKWMNYGCRMNGFGPVILDFPYVYELDGNKIYCQKKIPSPIGEHICGGEIDYDSSFDFLVCSKCGKKYKARDLENKNASIKLEINSEGSTGIMTRARIMKNGKVWKDSAPTSRTYVTKEQFGKMVGNVDLSSDVIVDKVVHLRSMKRENKSNYQSKLMMEYYSKSNATSAKINGLKRKTTKPENHYDDKNKKHQYRSTIKNGKVVTTKVSQASESQELELDDPMGYNELEVARRYESQHNTHTTKTGRTAFIRTNIKPSTTATGTMPLPYDRDLYTRNESIPRAEVQAPAIMDEEMANVPTEYEPVTTEFRNELSKALDKFTTADGAIIKEIIENADNKTKIEAEIEEAEFMRDAEEMSKKEIEAESEITKIEEEEEDPITEQAIELIKQGMFHNFVEPSYEDVYTEEEVEPQKETESPIMDQEEEEEIPFDNYRDVYHKRRKAYDDMSEF